MLTLNSYGLATRPAARSSNDNKSGWDVLPRFCGGGLPAVREIRSLTKLDMMMRSREHPLYRTTTGYDYGRYADFKDVALSCPKQAKPAGFTKEFIAGNYVDNSLLSLESSKRRAEVWQQKMAARNIQMQVKHAELQVALEEKKQLRRAEREKRRKEMEGYRWAVVQLQARLRGFLTRSSLEREKRRRNVEAALCIQRASRSRAKIRAAKQILHERRCEWQQSFVIKIQRVFRAFVQCRCAKRQLMELQEDKRQKAIVLDQETQRQFANAASTIQRMGRVFLVRKSLLQASSTSITVSDKDSVLTSRIRSRGAHRVIAQMQQVRRRNIKATVRLAKPLIK